MTTPYEQKTDLLLGPSADPASSQTPPRHTAPNLTLEEMEKVAAEFEAIKQHRQQQQKQAIRGPTFDQIYDQAPQYPTFPPRANKPSIAPTPPGSTWYTQTNVVLPVHQQPTANAPSQHSNLPQVNWSNIRFPPFDCTQGADSATKWCGLFLHQDGTWRLVRMNNNQEILHIRILSDNWRTAHKELGFVSSSRGGFITDHPDIDQPTQDDDFFVFTITHVVKEKRFVISDTFGHIAYVPKEIIAVGMRPKSPSSSKSKPIRSVWRSSDASDDEIDGAAKKPFYALVACCKKTSNRPLIIFLCFLLIMLLFTFIVIVPIVRWLS